MSSRATGASILVFPVTVYCYTTGARANHWITATCLVLLALTGLALFSPWLYFITAMFGGGDDTGHPSVDRRGAVLQLRRTVYPILAVNLWKAEDGTCWRGCVTCSSWSRGTPAGGRQIQCRPEGSVSADVDPDHRADRVAAARCAPGRRRHQYRAEAHRVLVHSAAAVIIICVWIVQIYAAIGVRGTIGAMTRGQLPAAGAGGTTASGFANWLVVRQVERPPAPAARCRPARRRVARAVCEVINE